MAAKGIGVLWFSFEVTPKKFLEKYRFDHSPKIYVPLQKISGNLKWIEERIWEAKLKHDCRVIFVDHLHFVVDLLRERNVSIEIGQAMRFLKSVALRHNVCVFLISHLSKLKFETEPTENDLRDSSFIAQESDGTLMIYRLRDSAKNENDPNPYSNRARLVVCCARRSGAMRVRIPLIKSGDDLVELTGGLL
jgi:replicative DNA helicase